MLKNNSTKLRHPQFCYLTITENCILRCKTCHVWNNERKLDEPTIEEWKIFLESLSEMTETEMELHISGGEPLLKEGVTELIGFGVKKGFNVTMATNAYLIDEKVAKQIIDSGLKTIVISLNSLDEDIHDFLKGISGSYKKTMNAIQYLTKLKSDLQICICTIIAEQTLDGLMKLTEWVSQHDGLSAISFQAITQPFHTHPLKEWYRESNFNFLWPKDAARVDYVLEELIRLKQEGVKIGNSGEKLRLYQSYFRDPHSLIKPRCNVGDYAITMLPNGDMSLCRFGSLGNIRKDDIRDIWFSKKARQIRKEMKVCRSNCEHLINGSYEDNEPQLTKSKGLRCRLQEWLCQKNL